MGGSGSTGNGFEDACKPLISKVCIRFQEQLGLQEDSVRNQVEHVEALWKSFLSRHRGNARTALTDLWSQLLRSQRSWRARVWRPLLSQDVTPEAEAQPSEEEALSDICLYFLLWGELGNVRFCPEVLSFLVTAASEYCSSGQADRKSRRPEGAFLNEIVKPIFNVMTEETYQPGNPPKFKYGRAPAPARACNYDDWNELFWDPQRLKNALRLKSGEGALVSSGRQACDIWLRLPDVDWALSLRAQKSHLEMHCALPMLVGCYRIFMGHTLAFCCMIIFSMGNDRVTPAWQHALGLVVPGWMTLYEVGYQILTPSMPLRSRLRGFLTLIFIYWLPVATYVCAMMHINGWSFFDPVTVAGGTIHLDDAVLPFHVFVSLTVLLVAMVPRWDNRARRGFQPELSRRCVVARLPFWTAVLGAKVAFDYLVIRYCASALLRVIDTHRLDRFERPWLLAPPLATLLLPAAICCLGSMSFFLQLGIGIVGAAKGLWTQGGLNFRTRHGWGLKCLPEHLSRLVLQPIASFASGPSPAGRPHPQDDAGQASSLERSFEVAPDTQLSTARRSTVTWWQGLPERELRAFVDVWNAMLEDLRRHDLLSDQEVLDLTCQPPHVIPRLLDSSGLANALPPNKEARRRIVTLHRSLMNRMAPEGCVREMPSLTVLVPHYAETILFSDTELFVEEGISDMLSLLVQYYQGELQNFAERMHREREFGRRSVGGTHRDVDALRKWASLRMQTLWRTVDGVCSAYETALMALLRQQDRDLTQASRNALVKEKLQVVIAMQRYAKFSDPRNKEYDRGQADAVEKMLEAFGGTSSQTGRGPTVGTLCIAYIEEVDSPEGKRYFSCLVDASCPLARGRRVPRLRIELPGYPILGHGKSDNQNCALIFSRGEVMQMIDANQEAYFEASLFLPLALQEFNVMRGGRRPGILGFREHIFSDMGLLGKVAADWEFAFGTVVQRTMDWPLEARLHYGHPDMMDKLQMMQQGGLSKATRGLNLSEDIFAGLDLALRGGWTAYREYFHVGKGRDMGFMSVMSFYSKISMGNGEQAITRQWMRLGLHLSLERLLGIFYTHIGFFLSQYLLNTAMKALAFMVAYYSISDLVVHKGWSGPADAVASQYFTIFYLFFVMATMMPLVMEIGIELGLRATCRNLFSSLLRLNPVFAAFQSKLMGYYFMNTVYYGGAQYVPTGRGLATTKEDLAKLYRSFAPSHMNDAFEAALFLVFSFGIYYSNMFYFCMGLAVFSWTMAPFLFNPRQFDSPCELCKDFKSWLAWLVCGEGSEEVSWTAWCIRVQESRKTATRRWLQLPSGRLLAVACSLGLVLEDEALSGFSWSVEWARDLWRLLPPVWHVACCAVLGLFSVAGVEVPPDNSYPLLAMVAGLVSASEICFMEWSKIDHDRSLPALLFHKYLCIRFLLEVADNLAVHRPGGRALSWLHAGCRLWALSWRWLRDFAVGAVLWTVCLLLALLPGMGRLHACFLFRTCKRKEAMTQERLLSVANLGSSANFSTQNTAQHLLSFLLGFDPDAPPASSA